LILFFYIITILYALGVLAFIIFWEKIPLNTINGSISSKTKISVIIAVRNEEDTISLLLEDLNKQSYPNEKFEVIVIDDYSTDRTIEKLKAFSAKYSLKIISLTNESAFTGNKKRCIEKGIQASEGDLVITTDGDCRVGKDWINAIENFYISSGSKMIVGPVSFFESDRFFKQMQTLEFASLIGSGAACLTMGIPNMCNGANLAYEKSVFYEVDGFTGNEQVPSGDDEFLMHKVYGKYPQKVKFLKDKRTIVYTDSKNSIQEFVNQRKRWASKWAFYKIINIKLVASFIFLFNLSNAVFFGLVFFGVFPPVLFLEQILIKVCLEFVFLRQVLRFFDKKIQWLPFFVLQLIYPFYVIFFALGSLTGKYEWKGRKINRL
jgi:cellulose synthase/poly-beta-1,6-N-acetylglucosamine synthase-like glycosyltransferase